MQPTPQAGISQLVFFALIFIAFYFLLIVPQKKKQQQHKKMIDELKKNDEVVTAGGIHGTVVNVKDKTFVLRVDENTRIEVDKPSIAYIEKQRNDQA